LQAGGRVGRWADGRTGWQAGGRAGWQAGRAAGRYAGLTKLIDAFRNFATARKMKFTL